MSIKKYIKNMIPYGIMIAYQKKQETKIIANNNAEQAENIPIGNITKTIGNDWKSHPYYDHAEKTLSLFWNTDTVFYKYFQQLDLSNVVELACGHGRHVTKYLADAQKITLMDINEENIDFCKSRFSGENKINYLVNSGNSFTGVENNSVSAIFSYDSMVHFELTDIASYLKDAYRILIPGGKVLFHHSNAAFSPELYYRKKPHSRNYMSADIFKHLAIVSGFKILSQTILPWGEGSNFYKGLDCVSLCEKIL